MAERDSATTPPPPAELTRSAELTPSAAAQATEGSRWLQGRRTLLSAGITLLTVIIGYGLIALRLQSRESISEHHVLRATEVRSLPADTLAVVLARDDGAAVSGFNYRLLRLVMQQSGVPHAIGLTPSVQPQDEVVEALASGSVGGSRNPEAITVAMLGAGATLKRRLQPVPIPVSGGLLGLRVGWIHRDRAGLTASIRTPQQLQELVLLQGVGWKDVKVLDHAGMRTYTTRPRELLRLVHYNRVDLYPRGLTELEREHPEVLRDAPNVVVDPHLIIVYPFAGFFHVSRNNPQLANAIETGFRRAIANGSYQRLLEQHLFTPWLKRQLDLPQRRLIYLPNPEAAQLLQDVDPEHWILPWDQLARGTLSTGYQLCNLPRWRLFCDSGRRSTQTPQRQGADATSSSALGSLSRT